MRCRAGRPPRAARGRRTLRVRTDRDRDSRRGGRASGGPPKSRPGSRPPAVVSGVRPRRGRGGPPAPGAPAGRRRAVRWRRGSMTRRSARSCVSSAPRPTGLEVSPEERGAARMTAGSNPSFSAPTTADCAQPTPQTARPARSPPRPGARVAGIDTPSAHVRRRRRGDSWAPPAWRRGTLRSGASQPAAPALATGADRRRSRPHAPAGHQPRHATACLARWPNDSGTRTEKVGRERWTVKFCGG